MLRQVAFIALCVSCAGSASQIEIVEPASAGAPRNVSVHELNKAEDPPRNPPVRVAQSYLRSALQAAESGSVKVAHATLEARAQRNVTLLTCLDEKRDGLETVIEFLEAQAIAEDNARRAQTVSEVHVAWEEAETLVRGARACR